MKNIQAKLQTFAGAMMVPIILLVLVGFFVGIGSAFTNYILPEGNILYNLFTMITNLGFMFMNNLQLLKLRLLTACYGSPWQLPSLLPRRRKDGQHLRD